MLIERVKEFISRTSLQRILIPGFKDQKEFAELFYEVFKRSPQCSGCSSTVSQELSALEAYANGKPLPIIYNGTMKLLKDQIVWDKVSKAHYSSVSSGMSENILWNVLAYNPEESFKMDGLPENWKEIAAAKREEIDARALVNGAEVVAKTTEAAKVEEPVNTTVIEGNNVVVNDVPVVEKPVSPPSKTIREGKNPNKKSDKK